MLTANQEKFAKCIALENMNQSDAYRAAYPNQKMSAKTIWEKASALAANGKVQARIKELREASDAPEIMSAQERKEWLTGVIKNEKLDIRARLQASDQLNKMQGEYVQKVEASVKAAKLEDLI